MNLDGLLLVDKPADITSHDVVHRARKILKQKSIGHTGTLDPLATGLMILVLGEATKLSDYLTGHDKSYRVRVRAGVTTDSLDRMGKVLSETPCSISEEQWRIAIAKLQGDFEWPVPIFSAAKVDGKKLYEHGRDGTPVAIPVKKMTFWSAELEEFDATHAQVRVSCSKGSFIRSWAAQLGGLLGVGAVVDELRRLTVGTFDVHQAVRLDGLEDAQSSEVNTTSEMEAFVPMVRALPAWKALMAGPREAKLVANGQVPRDLVNRLIFEQKQAFDQGFPVFVKVLSQAGQLLAILAAEPGQGLKIRRVFR